jgi:hypothetical protein
MYEADLIPQLIGHGIGMGPSAGRIRRPERYKCRYLAGFGRSIAASGEPPAHDGRTAGT